MQDMLISGMVLKIDSYLFLSTAISILNWNWGFKITYPQKRLKYLLMEKEAQPREKLVTFSKQFHSKNVLHVKNLKKYLKFKNDLKTHNKTC